MNSLGPVAALSALLLSLAACSGGATAPTEEPGPVAAPAMSSSAPNTHPTRSPSAPATSAPATPPSVTTTPARSVDCRKLKCVALTYDDGPSPLTPKLLKILRTRKAPATFFLLGNSIDQHPETVKKMHQWGFEIGNHSTTHVNLATVGASVISTELATTQTKIQKITGSKPTLMRPPYGGTNAAVARVAGQHKLVVVNWHTSPEDWVYRDRATIVKLTLQRARAGSILLMHDTHAWTVDAQAAVIDGLRQKGYTLVTVSQLIGAPKAGTVIP